mmetsp:Transcript_9872/g.40463  ORF Transcript_9872/g.40463 Transcript_9872/m.40463 type:complete len:202 (+) Transcript_9872:9728-10333(+)
MSGASRIMFVNSVLMPSNLLESSGSCTRISCDPMKTLSSMLHFFATSAQTDSTLSTVPSFFCHSSTISWNFVPCTYLFEPRFWSSRLSFSSASTMRSSTTMLTTSESGLNGTKSRCKPAQSFSIFTSCFSITSSFCARSTISETLSAQVCSSSARRSPSENFSSIVNFFPVTCCRSFQCLSRIAGCLSSATSGSEVSSALT